jgi:alpha-tubulin suppressor-like RCC1 family protein
MTSLGKHWTKTSEIMSTKNAKISACVLRLTGTLAILNLSSSSVFGQVFVWGHSTEGQTNLPAMTTNVVALAGGDLHCVALLADRTVQAWPNNLWGQTTVPAEATNVFGIAAGSRHTLAVRGDGDVLLWGMISSGTTTVSADATNVVAVAMGPGAQHAVALRADGMVVEWGSVADYEPVLANIPPAVTNIVSVAAGAFHTVALRSDGRVVAWGDNGSRQLDLPPSATNIVAIAAGWHHSAALRADGRVLTWGTISSGSLAPSPFATNIIELACGGNHVLALRRDGRVFAWGANNNGQLNVPAAATNLAVIGGNSAGSMAAIGEGPPVFPSRGISRTVASGETAFLRLTAVGERPVFYQWHVNGTNVPGATNEVLILTNALPHQSGVYSLVASNALGVATNADIVLAVWPVMITNQPLSQWTYVGATVALNVAAAGQGPLTYQWQFNGTNVLGATNENLVLTNVQDGNTGQYTVLVSNALGTATSSVAQLSVAPILIASEPQDRVIFRGGSAAFTVQAQSSEPVTYQWQFNGTNLPGATTSNLLLTSLQYAHSGPYFVTVSNSLGVTNSVANLSVVSVAAWGANESGQTNVPAGLTNVIALAGGNSHSLALNADGTFNAWGDNGFGQESVPALLTNAVAISAALRFSLALNADGTVAGWGYSASGVTDIPEGLTNVVMVDAGSAHGLALKSDGSVVAWGPNSSGQTNVPSHLSNAVAIAAGSFHSLALRIDGTVVAWGSNTSGQTNVPTALTNAVAVAAGSSHSLALKKDGTVSVWGSTSFGLQDVPLSATNIVAIGAGTSYCMALKADGTVIAWGSSSGGRTNVPSGLTNVVAIAASSTHSLALIGEGPVDMSVFLSNPVVHSNVFSVSLPTRSGRVYALEFKYSVDDSNWIALPLVAGNGGIRILTDPAPTGTQRFYRVRQW